MRQGSYIIGGSDLRVADKGPPADRGERRHANRYILLPDPTVSHQHAELIVERDRVRLVDLGSPRGTYVGNSDGRHRVYDIEVEPGTPVRLGRWHCTIADLLAAVDRLENRWAHQA